MFAILRAIRLAIRALLRSPMRASLTVLGILIGVAGVVLSTAIGTGVRDSVAKSIESLGSNAMIIFPQQAVASGARGAQGTGKRLTEEDGRALAREIVGLAAVCPNIRTLGQVVFGDKNVSTNIIGTTLPYFKVRNWAVARGSAWEEHDETAKGKVILLGNTVAEKLFGATDPVGRLVRIGRYPFRVLGVLEVKGEAQPFGDQDDIVVMPIGSFRGRVMRTPPGFAGVLFASAASSEVTDHAVDQIEAILRQRHHIAPDAQPDFVIRTQKEFQQMRDRVFGMLNLILIIVAGISLLVGGIGVMNIMLVSVAERTREIGIRMAIGARENDIRTQFLVEAVVLAIVGGLAGAAVGIGGIAIFSSAIGMPMPLSPLALGISIGVAGLTGVAFGFMPARRASRLDPIEALRHE